MRSCLAEVIVIDSAQDVAGNPNIPARLSRGPEDKDTAGRKHSFIATIMIVVVFNPARQCKKVHPEGRERWGRLPRRATLGFILGLSVVL
jgi:hypothetical protein